MNGRHFQSISLLAFVTILIFVTRVSAAVYVPSDDDLSSETLVTAAEMKSDQNTGIITAIGKVEIARDGYILHADKVIYNQKTGVMRAEGHVALMAPTGEVSFASEEEITGDMKQAFAENASVLFPDNSRMAVKTVQRYEGRYSVGTQGAYTACNVCKENPDNPPLWQIQATKIIHDNDEHNIYYHDATVDFAGVPVFYTPYMSSPDPTVTRRQGFLAATPGYTSSLGAFVKVPYYFDIAPDADAVLAPTFSDKDKVQMEGEVRKRFDDGSADISGSITHAQYINDAGNDEGDRWRGHIFGSFLYDIDNVWRAGTDVQLVTDNTYLPLYRYSSADILTSKAYIEGFNGRDYSSVTTYHFQDLRQGIQPVQPYVLPVAQFNALGEPGQTWGGRWSINGNMLTTSRDNTNESLAQQGPDTRRLYMDAGWQRQFTSDTGLLTTVDSFVRGDSYWADNVVDPSENGTIYNNVLMSRQFEQASATVRYPIGRNGDGYQQILEPIAETVVAPNVHVSAKQPIEDSASQEFDETNLFALNRFTGYDLIEGGSRVVYGMRHAITTDSGGKVDMFGGQSLNLSQNNNDFSSISGLQDRSSDYVGRLDTSPAPWLTFNYGFRLDHDNFSPQWQDALLSVGNKMFRPYARYINGYMSTTTSSSIFDDKEITTGFDSQLTKYWKLHAEHVQAFSPQPGPRSSSIILTYADECYILGVSMSQNNTTGLNISSGTSILFHMFLKNIGGIQTDSFSPNANAFPAEFRQTE